MRSRYAIVILFVLFAGMSVVSWERWANPVIDSGREMNTPLRLMQGQQIYTDVYYLFGPVSQYFNSFLYSVFGVHLRTLYAAGLTGSLLLILLIFYIGRKFMSGYEALLAAAAVLLLCVFKQGGNMIVPYSYAVLYGTLLGTLSLALQLNHIRNGRTGALVLAGAISGLALCCKIEFGFAAVACLAAVVITAPREQRRRVSALAILSASIFPVLIYGILLLRTPIGPLFKDTFLFPGSIPAEFIYFNKMKLGLNNPGRTLREMISAAALLSGVAGGLALAGLRMAGEPILPPMKRAARRLWWITATSLGLILFNMLLFGTHWDLNPFRAFPLLFLGMVVYCFVRKSRDKEWDFLNRGVLLLSTYSLAVLARVIIRVPAGGSYGAGLVPVPLLLFIYIAGRNFLAVSPAAAAFRRRLVLAALSMAIASTAVVLAYRQLKATHLPLKTARGEIRLIPSRMNPVSNALEFITRNSSPGEYILALPEGSALNFLADRPVPTRYEIMTPGYLSTQSKEEEIIRQIEQKRVQYIFLLNRPTTEFGAEAFGRDYCRHLMAWIESNYETAAIFGEDTSPQMEIGDPRFFIKCYRKKKYRGRTDASPISSMIFRKFAVKISP